MSTALSERRSVSLYRGRAPAELIWLAPPDVLSRAEFALWAAGATIARAGEQTRRVDILVEGIVDEIVGGLVLRSHEAGTLIGANRAPGDQPSAGTIHAETTVVVLTVPVSAMRGVASSPEVGFWLADQLQHRERAIRRASGLRGPIQL
jgi:CRP-like cAMP-binding protein